MGWKKPFGTLGGKGPVDRGKEFAQREVKTLHTAPEGKIGEVSASVGWLVPASRRSASLSRILCLAIHPSPYPQNTPSQIRRRITCLAPEAHLAGS